MKKESRHCKSCGKVTEHIGVVVNPKVSESKSTKEKVKEFLSYFVAGWGAGATAGFMELRELHLICSKCGNKLIEHFRNDLNE